MDSLAFVRGVLPWVVFAAASIVLPACSTVDVNTDYDRSVDFTKYRTFNWLPDPSPRTGNPRLDDPFVRQRIESAVESELIAKGLRKASGAQADLLVGYHLAVAEKLDVRVVDTYYGYGSPYGFYRGYYGPAWVGQPVFSDVHVTQFEEGTLILDIAERAGNRLVWRGIGQARLQSGLTPDQREQRIRSGVADILARFPPKS